MKYINELREGETVIEHYLCKSRQSMKSRNGKTYLSLKLQDKTGIVDAKVWDMNKDIQSFQENDFIKIDAFVTTFNNEFDVATYKTKTTEQFTSPDNWKPGEEVAKTIVTTNEGSIPAAVRVSYKGVWTDSEGNELTDIREDAVIINLDNEDEDI